MRALTAVHRETPVRQRVVVVHRDRSIRDAFRALLEHSGVPKVATASPSELGALLHPARPLLLLVVLDGVAESDDAIVREMEAMQPPASAVVVASATTGMAHLARARAVPQCLVVGDQPGVDLVDLVRRTSRQPSAPDVDPVETIVEESHLGPGGAAVELLNPVDREIVLHIKRGRTIREIADSLALTEADARERLLRILDTLGLVDRVQLAVYPLQPRPRSDLKFHPPVGGAA